MEIVPIKQKSVNAKPKQVSQKNEHITNSTKNLVILSFFSAVSDWIDIRGSTGMGMDFTYSTKE